MLNALFGTRGTSERSERSDTAGMSDNEYIVCTFGVSACQTHSLTIHTVTDNGVPLIAFYNEQQAKEYIDKIASESVYSYKIINGRAVFLYDVNHKVIHKLISTPVKVV